MIGELRARVLIVDDEHLNRRLIQAILAPERYELVSCESGNQALELIARGGIDLVLLDVMMPGIDGLEVCRRIREDIGDRTMPVIVISALADAQSRTRGKRAGADDFLTKPIHEDELLVRVRNLLQLRACYRESEQQRIQAQRGARRWRIASELATAVATCLDYGNLTERIFKHLEAELRIERATLYATYGDEREQLASAGGSPECETGDHVEALAIRDGGEYVGLLYVARSEEFDEEERQLLMELEVHVGNGFAHVRSHLASVSRLFRARSEHEQAEAALRASEERYRLLFDASPLPIWVFEPTTLEILAVNDVFSTTLGYTRHELVAMRVSDIKPPEDVAPMVMGLKHATIGHTHRVGVVRYVRKDGRTVELDISSHATALDDELVILAVGVDVTESRRLEEQLRQSQKMDAIGQLAGGVAHDFNNILAAIISNAELALEDLGESHANASDLREIGRAAHRATVLTRQLLTFCRQERRQVAVLSVSSIVKGIEKMLTRVVPEDIMMTTVVASSPDAVEADAGQLEQLVMNLVVNARDAMPEGGRLIIETGTVDVTASRAAELGVGAGRFVTLSVTDTGCGMDRATQSRIFEPFFTTKPVGKGTGLGLATVFGIVKQSRGGLTVESEPGRGSTFRIFLPCVDGEPHAKPAATQRIKMGSGVVLVVEDDVMLRAVIRRQLMSWGYSILEAANGNAALELLESARPIDLLLTDLVMPGIDGRALARKVVAARPATKVLFMSGYTDHPAVKTAASEDAHLIEKPFTGASLSAALRRALTSA